MHTLLEEPLPGEAQSRSFLPQGGKSAGQARLHLGLESPVVVRLAKKRGRQLPLTGNVKTLSKTSQIWDAFGWSQEGSRADGSTIFSFPSE